MLNRRMENAEVKAESVDHDRIPNRKAQRRLWAARAQRNVDLCLREQGEKRPRSSSAPPPTRRGNATKEATKGLKQNFSRLERVARTAWLAFSRRTRPWLMLEAEGWCQLHGSAWYDASNERMPAGPIRQQRHIDLLCEKVHGFEVVLNFFALDLRFAVEPFWHWEEGNPIPLLESFDYITCYFAFYECPTLTKTALTTLNQLLHYLDVSPAGRPDLLVLICLNCVWLNERLLELHHARQMHIGWHGDLTISSFKHFSCLMNARVGILEVARENRNGQTSRRAPQIKRLHDAAVKSRKGRETREIVFARQKEIMLAAAQGYYETLHDEPNKIKIGHKNLTNPEHSCSAMACERWVIKSGAAVDPLYRKTMDKIRKYMTQHSMDVKVEEDAIKQTKGESGLKKSVLKSDLIAVLRTRGYKKFMGRDGIDDSSGDEVIEVDYGSDEEDI